MNKNKFSNKYSDWSFEAVIEISAGSSAKFEMDRSGNFRLDRYLGASLTYPFAYGFIPQTLSGDGDALDVLVLTDKKLKSKQKIIVKPIGVLKMKDEHGGDDKIITVLKNDSGVWREVNDINDLSWAWREKIDLFFRHYKEFAGKRWSRVIGFGDLKEAKKITTLAIDRLKQ